MSSSQDIWIGVIADTHIPDRVRDFPTGLLQQFRNAEVDLIVHAGDVSSWRAIRTLEEIAPVTIVQGNRD
ncbi:metallophosphoesterase family protein [bacterium]|nr:metallophosphoesterase family protein [bacterium]